MDRSEVIEDAKAALAVERIALVLYHERMRIWRETAPASLRDPPITWQTESESFREQIRREARLAIEAMSPPSA